MSKERSQKIYLVKVAVTAISLTFLVTQYPLLSESYRLRKSNLFQRIK